MNAITHIPTPAEPTGAGPIPAFDRNAPTPDNIQRYGFTPSRYDGWTPERQKVFLQAISEGHGIQHACRIVGMSKQSAYAFRRRPQGGAFALGWQAACLLARDELADELLDRARNGVIETVTHRDGTSTERQRFDNRLAMHVLNRLDRLADRGSNEVGHAAARLVAAEFDQFLDTIERGPARAGTFLCARAQEADEADLAPIRALARADRWLRAHAGLAAEVDASDLDPAQRARWSGEQWARAEAAGLVALAPPPPPPAPAPKPETTPSESQLRQPSYVDPMVWWDEDDQDWRTRYPAPPGFDGYEEGEYGEGDYARSLTLAEEEAIDAPRRAEIAEQAVREAAERDELFGFTPAPLPGKDAEPRRLAAPAPEAEPEAEAAPDAPALALPERAHDAKDEDEDDFGDEDDNWDYAKDDAWRAGEIPDSEMP